MKPVILRVIRFIQKTWPGRIYPIAPPRPSGKQADKEIMEKIKDW
jgi:hypothetical protein